MKADADFLRDLEASHAVSMRVAMYLQAVGHNVRLFVPTVRKTAEERWEHTDSGDIEITKSIEVKQRGFDFHDAASYPYPTIYLGEVYKVDKIWRDLYGFVLTNSSITHAACVDARTKKHWLVETRFDAKQGRDCSSYACPKEFAQFVNLAGEKP